MRKKVLEQKETVEGKKKLLSVNRFECSVINRTQFKGSGNLRRFLSRLTNFLQHTVSARRRHLLHIRAAGCLKKKKKARREGEQPPHTPYIEQFSTGKRTSVKTGHFSKFCTPQNVIFVRKSVFGCFQERARVFCAFNFAMSNDC